MRPRGQDSETVADPRTASATALPNSSGTAGPDRKVKSSWERLASCTGPLEDMSCPSTLTRDVSVNPIAHSAPATGLRPAAETDTDPKAPVCI